MDVSTWTDAAAIEAWLLEQSRRDDAALDLAAMALALAALNRGADAAPAARHLEALAREAAAAGPALAPAGQVRALNALLFQRYRYAGDSETYDDLANADLIRVVERRKGLPIALAILYIHAARGAGWEAEGVNFPGHFLVRIGGGEGALVVDPFARGAVLGAGELERLLKRMAGDEAVLAREHLAAAGNRDMLLRLQNNIKLRCLKREDTAGALVAVERMALVAPANPAVWHEAAALNAELGQLQRARTCFAAVARLDPGGRLGKEAEAMLGALRNRLN
jgi:regulator of sirC expression with transglutaminase-like and TPR domain